MCKFIGIECVAGNAIIELMQMKQVCEVSFERLIRYGLEVVEDYTINTSEKAVLIFDENEMNNLFVNCSSYFKIEKRNDEKYLCLREGFEEINLLKEKFQYSISYDLLKAFLSKESLKVLGAA